MVDISEQCTLDDVDGNSANFVDIKQYKLPEDEEFITLLEFQGRVVVCSDKSMYWLHPTKFELMPIEIKILDKL